MTEIEEQLVSTLEQLSSGIQTVLREHSVRLESLESRSGFSESSKEIGRTGDWLWRKFFLAIVKQKGERTDMEASPIAAGKWSPLITVPHCQGCRHAGLQLSGLQTAEGLLIYCKIQHRLDPVLSMPAICSMKE